jgi:large repetitive protein
MKLSFLLPLLLVGIAGHCASVMAQGTFTATGSMTTPRMGHTATLLHNGKVLIAGGWQSVPEAQSCSGYLHYRSYFLECVILLTSAELYNPSTGTFAATGNMTTAHLFHTATLLPDGRVLIDWETGDYELYDDSKGTFSSIDNMTTRGNTATLLGNGKVLVTGLPAELYDPSAGTFAATGAYAGTSGSLVTATLLPDGRVLARLGRRSC